MLIHLSKKIVILTMCCALLGGMCTTMSISEARKSKEKRTMQNCEPLPLKILRKVHGAAFDARYMSITEPTDNDETISDTMDDFDVKRNAAQRPSFYITDDHMEVLSEEPAWNIDWDTFSSSQKQMKRKKRSLLPIGVDPTENATQSDELNRQKRQNRGDPWKCERKVKWVHLGPDYHPSHLRTVECTRPKCYYQQYNCKPRHFAVHILQRRRGACADAKDLKMFGFAGKYAEVWVLVEIAVNFCCDCVAPKHFFEK